MQEYGIEGDWITLDNLQETLDKFRNEVSDQLQIFGEVMVL